MSKNYDNEIKLVESLLNNHNKIYAAQKYIKENFGLSTLFDESLSLLYIWNENLDNDEKVSEAEKYIKETFNEYLLETDTYKPEIIKENTEEVFVVYLDDKTMAEICNTEDEAKKKVDELNKEYKDNKAIYKKEQKSNYVKQ